MDPAGPVVNNEEPPTRRVAWSGVRCVLASGRLHDCPFPRTCRAGIPRIRIAIQKVETHRVLAGFGRPADVDGSLMLTARSQGRKPHLYSIGRGACYLETFQRNLRKFMENG